MYKLKKLSDVPKKSRIEHAISLSIEALMFFVSLGYLIYNMVIGDPENRKLACLGSMCCFMLPFLIEVIFKCRFSFTMHMLADVYMIFTVFCGSALNYFKTIGPFDEIGHFLFGYFCCILFFYVFLAWDGSKKLSKGMAAFAIFMLSMAIAPLWEITEFCADLFLAQDSMGYVTEEFIQEAQAQGLTGFNYAVYKLMNGVTVWDTITDMALHFGGSILFIIQYLVYRNVKKSYILGAMEKDYYQNKEAFYVKVDKKAETEDNSEKDLVESNDTQEDNLPFEA